jgi:putative ABC transport system permease protein
LAASDLGLKPGDTLVLRHPSLQADGSITLVDTPLTLLGVHPHPFRFIAYVDTNHLSLLAPSNVVNLVKIVPAAGASTDQLKRELFQLPATGSIEQVGDVARAIRDLLNEFVVVLRVVEGAMLLIALLIAFNSASINMDERAREHATMFAFGVPVFTVLRMAIIENLIIGIGATLGGVIGGWFLLRLIMATRVASTFPDIYIKPVIAPETLALAVFLGVVMVALAPVFTLRRLRSMNVASSLKVAE